MPPRTEVVRGFLAAMAGHDWETMAGALAGEGFVRIGPYGDVYTGRDAYVTFIEGLLPTLPGYRMDVTRVGDTGEAVYVELTETVSVDGAPLRTPETLLFLLDEAGRIARIEVFIRQDAPDALP